MPGNGEQYYGELLLQGHIAGQWPRDISAANGAELRRTGNDVTLSNVVITQKTARGSVTVMIAIFVAINFRWNDLLVPVAEDRRNIHLDRSRYARLDIVSH